MRTPFPRLVPRRLRPLLLAGFLVVPAASSARGAEEATLAPPITAEAWLHSEPLGPAALRGKVVLVEFWTFACHNCQNVEPFVKRWHERYAGEGLVVVAVHTPELSFERDLDRVRRYAREHEITYPVAVDNDFSTWRAFGTRAWPTIYLVGKDGRIRYRRIGEGAYEATEAMIRELLAEAG